MSICLYVWNYITSEFHMSCAFSFVRKHVRSPLISHQAILVGQPMLFQASQIRDVFSINNYYIIPNMAPKIKWQNIFCQLEANHFKWWFNCLALEQAFCCLYSFLQRSQIVALANAVPHFTSVSDAHICSSGRKPRCK